MSSKKVSIIGLLAVICMLAGYFVFLLFKKYDHIPPVKCWLHPIVETNKLCRPSRIRPLFSLNRRSPKSIETILDEISDRYADKSEINVLEIGMGYGRVLMQLRKDYPAIELYGINKEKESDLSKPEDLIDISLFFNIFNKREADNIKLPHLYFFDLSPGKLYPFDDDFFDLIYSQATLMYLKRKDVLLKEAWRTLRPGGVAVLQIHNFDIFDAEGNAVSFEEYCNALRQKGYNVVCKNSTYTLVLEKDSKPEFEHGLIFDEQKSRWVDFDSEIESPGWHSAYRIVQ